LLHDALLAEQGSFTFSAEELPATKSLPLGNRWAVYLEQLRKTPVTEVQRRMQPAMNLPVMRSGGLVPVESLRLLPQEARALTFFDGVRSLAQLIADLLGQADTLLSTAWMLAPLELVSFADVPVPAPPPSRAAAPPPPVTAPVAPAVAAVPPPASGVPGPPPATSVPAPPPVAANPRPPQAPGSPPPAGVPGPPPAAVRVPGNPVMPQAPKMSVPYPGQRPSSPKPPSPGPAAAPPGPAVPPAPAGAPKPPVVTAAPAHAAPPAAEPPSAAVEAEVKQLTALLEKMKKQTYFEVLGVKKDADASAVKSAYFKLAKSYHPDTVAPGTPEALAKVKADIFALVGEANRVLSDPKLRAEYVAELEAGGTGEKVDVSAIFKAEELFQKGCILVKARKFADAVKMLDDAIKANPEEGEYYVWRGYAKFFGFSDRKLGQAEAMKDINYGLKKNPNVAAAQFFIGMMAKLNGDHAAAKKAFQQCVKMDPQHIDAQRELRLMR
jgi:DnaJ-domain-containing protein 1